MQRVFGLLLSLSFIVIAFAVTIPEKQLIGKWKMVKVVEGDKDITAKLNPDSNRWIELHDDHTFESDGTPYGRNTGNYIFDQKQMTLSLDSDAGDDDDSSWRVSFKQDTLVWKGIGSERQEKTYVSYIKSNK